MKSLSIFALLTAGIPILSAQCPSTPSPHFTCAASGSNTEITLFQNADLRWDRFDLASGNTLNITSSGGLFSSTHLFNGPARVSGSVTADGPFTILANSALDISGSITAPSVTLSTLPRIGSSYLGTTRARDLNISGNVTATSGDLTILAYKQSHSGNLEASGKVTLISTDSSTISSSDLTITPDTGFGQAEVITTGSVTGPVIEIYSDGFIANRGVLSGNDLITLSAPNGIAHDNRPGSSIQTGQLLVNSGVGVILQGSIGDPNDGSNPGGVSGVAEIPDVKGGSFSGKRVTTLLPTQFSSSTVSQSRLPSALKKNPRKPATRQLVTRGGAKKSVKKTSFFGIVTKK